MQRPARNSLLSLLAKTALITASYMLTATLGFSLAAPPGDATVVWPPSGIALAAVLLMGGRAAFGVWLGSFLVNTWCIAQPGSLHPTSLAVAAGVASGSALQALLGARLTRWLFRGGSLPTREQDILWFLGLQGLSCLVGACCRALSLGLGGAVAHEGVPPALWTWWLGNYAGVLVVTPGLVLLCRPRGVTQTLEHGVFPLVCLGVGLSLIGFGLARDRVAESAAARFAADSGDAVNNLRRHSGETLRELESLAAYQLAAFPGTRSGFRHFAAAPLERRTCLAALAWSPRVPGAEREAFERASRLEITEAGGQGARVRAGARDEYFPVQFRAPRRGPGPAAGFDLASDRHCRAAMSLARERGEAVATGTLPQYDEADGGFLLFWPVYRPPAEGARPAFVGFAVGFVLAKRLVETALGEAGPRSLDLSVEDRAAPDGEPFRYSGPPRGGAPGAVGESRPSRTAVVHLGRRQWLVVCAPRAGAEDGGPWLLLAGGIVLTGLVAVYLSERRRVEEALRQGERRYRLLVDNASDVVWTADLDLRLTYISPSIHRLTGYTAEERSAQPVEQRLPLTYLEAARAALARALAEAGDQGAAGLGLTFEYETARKDGSPVWCESRTTFLLSPDGRPVGVLGVTRDVTERKRAERALREQQAILENVIANIPCAVFWKDTRGVYLGCNAQSARDLGMASPADVVGKTDRDMPVTEAEADSYVRCDREVMETGRPLLGIEETQRRRDGHQAVLITSKVPLRDAGGRTVGVLGVYTDVTERRRLEEQLRQAQKMEAVGRLAGGVAHDFNNLLTVINGYAEVALAGLGPGDPARDHLEPIRDAGARAAGLTRRLLAFSRKQVLAPVVLDLNALVAETGKLLAPVIGEDVRLEVRLAPGLWRVRADQGEIDQVVMNLAVNARDAMPKGGRLTIETRNVELAGGPAARQGLPEGRYVVLSVADTGHGMDEATRARLFEPFFTTKEVGKGTGLGLASAYGVVTQSGGHLEVESAPGAGTTFRVYLPRAEGPVTAGKSLPGLVNRARPTETVLLVEDEAAVRSLARRALELEGYAVLEASTGHEALAVCGGHAGPIHLLATDVVMPGMSGREVADRLMSSRPGLKVLFLSGYPADALSGYGVTDTGAIFLPKPYTPRSLARKVREVLEGVAAG
jgi:PAS domain S-box-containing protein